VRESKLYVSTRQFRMHGARNVDVYLHCASRPIIEDCEGVRFAPLPGGMVSYLILVSDKWKCGVLTVSCVGYRGDEGGEESVGSD
jgi:hypothetical protein